MRQDVFEELAEASRGREWFDGGSFSFRRLGSLKDADFEQLCRKLRRKKQYWAHRDSELAGMRKWRAANRAKIIAMCRRWYAEAKRDPAKWQRRLDSWRASDARKKLKNPERYRQLANERSRRYRARLKADPKRISAYRAQNAQHKRDVYKAKKKRSL